MATPNEVLAHAARVHNGTKFERARASATTLSTFLQLSADDKRNLAVLVAQRVAPELVPRIQAESGIDLTADQSRAVLDMISRLDGDDLDELSASVSTPEARRATLGAVTATAATATGLDDVVPATSSGSPQAPPAASAPGPAPDEALAGRVVALEASLAAAETTIRHGERSLEQARRLETQADERADDLEAQLRDAASMADVVRREHDAQLDELRRQLRRSTREVEESGGSSMSSLASAARPPTLPTSPSAFDMMPSFDTIAGADLLASDAADATADLSLGPPADTAARISDLVATLQAGSAGAALRTTKAWMPQLASTSPAERVRVLMAIPDGWARRRALQRMVEDGITSDADVSSLQLFARTSDQVFVAGAMLDAGVAYQALAPHLDPAARTRLERRLHA